MRRWWAFDEKVTLMMMTSFPCDTRDLDFAGCFPSYVA